MGLAKRYIVLGDLRFLPDKNITKCAAESYVTQDREPIKFYLLQLIHVYCSKICVTLFLNKVGERDNGQSPTRSSKMNALKYQIGWMQQRCQYSRANTFKSLGFHWTDTAFDIRPYPQACYHHSYLSSGSVVKILIRLNSWTPESILQASAHQ